MTADRPALPALLDLLRRGRYRDALAAVEGADRGVEGAVRARAMAMLGDTDAAMDLAREVLSRGVADDDLQAQTLASSYLASFHIERSQPVHALRLARRTVALARQADLPRVAAASLTTMSDLCSQLGDLVGATEALAEAQATVEALEQTHARQHRGLLLTRGLLALRRGDLDEVRDVLAARTDDEIASIRPVWATLDSLLAIAEGRLSDALESARRALDASPAPDRPDAVLLVVEVLRLLDRTDDAQAALAEALEDEVPDGTVRRHARVLAHLLELDRGVVSADAEATLREQARVGAPQTAWLAHLGVLRAQVLRDRPLSWDTAFASRPSWLGYAPANVAWELARVAEATAERPSASWASRAVRAWSATWESAHDAGATALAERARARLTRLSDAGAPVPLGPFVVGEAIGRGRQAQVREASTLLGRRVAVKIEHRVGARDTGELRHAAALRHPRVAPVLAFGTVPSALSGLLGCEPDARWVAMPLAEGTLSTLAGRMPWHRLRTVLVDVLTGLAHVHARGLLHLDIKPENVLVSSDPPRARLTDFGVSRALVRCAGPVPVAGTPAFMAPEQFDGEGRALGPWTDLYAVGGLVWSMVTGCPPFEGDLDDLIVASRVSMPDPLEPGGHVPNGFDAWVRGLMAKSPRDRYQRAADALRDLERLGDPVKPERLPLAPLRHPTLPTISLETLPDLPTPSSQPTLVMEPTRRAHRPDPVGDGPRSLHHARPTVPAEWRSERPDALPLDAAAQLALLPLRQPPTVGREAARDQLWAALREVSAEPGTRIVTVEGILGAGASHLARWLGRRAHALGVAHVWHTAADSGDLAFEALCTLARATERGPAAITRLLSALRAEGWPADLADEVAVACCGAEAPVPTELHALLGRAVTHLAAERTVVWIIDDLDRAPGAEALLGSLWGLPAPLLILGTCSHPPGAEPPRLASRVEGAQRLVLGPMSDGELHDLVDTLLPLDSTSAEQLVRASGGWPGELLAHVRARAAAGGLQVDGTVLRLHRRGDDPTGDAAWTDVVRTTLEPLSLGAAVAAELIGVLAPRVASATWARACAAAGVRSPDEAREALLTRRLILDDGTTVRPSHPSIARALVAHAREHGREGLLHEVAAEVADDPRDRAVHLRACGRPAEAVDAWCEAATRAAATLRVDAWAHLLDELQADLDACGPDHEGWYFLYGHRANLAEAHGDLDRSRRLLLRQHAHAEERGDRLWMARAHLFLARTSVFDGAAVADHITAARRHYDDLGLTAGQAACELALGTSAARRGSLERARLHLERAITLGADHPIAADAQRQLALVLARMGRHDEATATLQGAVEETKRGTREIFLRDAMAVLARHRGDLTEAEHHLREALALRPRGRARWITQLHLATVLFAKGEAEEGRRLTEALDAVVPRTGDDPVIWVGALLLVAEAGADDPDPRWHRGLAMVAERRGRPGAPSPEIRWALALAADRAEAAGHADRGAQLRELRRSLVAPTAAAP